VDRHRLPDGVVDDVRRFVLAAGVHFTRELLDCLAESRHGNGIDDLVFGKAIGILGLVRPDTAVAACSAADYG
jgi:hypothetical protein